MQVPLWQKVLYPGGLQDCYLTHLLVPNGSYWLAPDWPVHFLDHVWDIAHDNQEGHIPEYLELAFTRRLWPHIVVGLS